MRVWLALSCVCFMVLVGCTYRPAMLAEPVPVTGRLVVDSRPVVDATLMLQPMEYGYPTGLRIDNNGNMKGKAVAGKYYFYLQLPPNQYHQLKHLPDGILSPAPERIVEVPENGGEINIALKKQ